MREAQPFDLEALAVRCEAAVGGDRELDMEIAIAVGWHPPGVDPRLYRSDETNALYRHRTPLYSASLDAAMTLVPEGYDVCIETVGGWHYASVNPPEDEIMGQIEASSLPLALTAAALRARATMGGQL